MLSSITYGQVQVSVQDALLQLRRALDRCEDLQLWAAGVTVAQLVTAGGGSADAQAVLSGLADANGLAQLYNTGTDPRNPGPNYVYGASQRVVIGPQ